MLLNTHNMHGKTADVQGIFSSYGNLWRFSFKNFYDYAKVRAIPFFGKIFSKNLQASF